jgi:hypothetical protein
MPRLSLEPPKDVAEKRGNQTRPESPPKGRKNVPNIHARNLAKSTGHIARRCCRGDACTSRPPGWSRVQRSTPEPNRTTHEAPSPITPKEQPAYQAEAKSKDLEDLMQIGRVHHDCLTSFRPGTSSAINSAATTTCRTSLARPPKPLATWISTSKR